jgi:hypothetical protein
MQRPSILLLARRALRAAVGSGGRGGWWLERHAANKAQQTQNVDSHSRSTHPRPLEVEPHHAQPAAGRHLPDCGQAAAVPVGQGWAGGATWGRVRRLHARRLQESARLDTGQQAALVHKVKVPVEFWAVCRIQVSGF